jgi:hypothetical protein
LLLPQMTASLYLGLDRSGRESDPFAGLVGGASQSVDTSLAFRGRAASDCATSDSMPLKCLSEFANCILKAEV